MEVDDEDVDAALVDSYFLPGGLLDPEHYEDDQLVQQKRPTILCSPFPIQKDLLPCNPWALDAQPNATKQSVIGSPCTAMAPPTLPLHLQPPLFTTNATLASNLHKSLLQTDLANFSALSQLSALHPPPGFRQNAESKQTINPMAPTDKTKQTPMFQKEHYTNHVTLDALPGEENLSQYSIPKELLNHHSTSSSTSSLSTSTYGKNDSPSTKTAQTEKETIDEEIPAPMKSPQSEPKRFIKTTEKREKFSSIPAAIEGQLSTELPLKAKKSRRSRPRKRISHKTAIVKFQHDIHIEDKIPLLKSRNEEPKETVDAPDSDVTTKSFNNMFSFVTVLFFLAGSLTHGITYVLNILFDATSSVWAVLTKLSTVAGQTSGRYVAICLSITVLMYGQATMMVVEDFTYGIHYVVLYLAPSILTLLSDMICLPHWIPHVLGTAGLLYQCVLLEEEWMKRCTREKNALSRKLSASTKHPITTTQLHTSEQTVFWMLTLQYMLFCLFCWDGFSTEYGFLLGLPTSGRLLVAYTFCVLRHGRSCLLWVSWAGQFLVVCWCPRSLLVDQLLLVIGLSSIRVSEQLRKCNFE